MLRVLKKQLDRVKSEEIKRLVANSENGAIEFKRARGGAQNSPEVEVLE